MLTNVGNQGASEAAKQRRARLATDGQGAWKDLAQGRDLVADLLAERETETAVIAGQ
jgi:hypothetical protein